MPTEMSVGREDAGSPDAVWLVEEMCAELRARYHRPPSPFLAEEAMAPRTAFVVARVQGRPAGCGALRQLDATTVEVKRMYVVPSARRQGIAARVLAELERLAGEFGYGRIILETGSLQPEALALYSAAGYQRIAAYGRYIDNAEAHCFEKILGSNLGGILKP